MKLYSILFESVGESDVINFIKDIIKSDTETGIRLKHTFLFPMRDNNRGTPMPEQLDKLAKDIYKQNKDQFDRIFKDVEKAKYLGAGSIGVVFDLGDKILKIEEESEGESYSAGERAEKAATALYPEPKNKATKSPETSRVSTSEKTADFGPRKSLEEEVDRKIGKYVPMIYDKGVIAYSYAGIEIKLNWIIMEKFEHLPHMAAFNIVDDILMAIMDVVKFFSLEKLKDIKNYSPSIQQDHDKLGSKLRLKDGWFADLVQGMHELQSKKMSDFHAGNIGIRRTGAEGSLVFFD